MAVAQRVELAAQALDGGFVLALERRQLFLELGRARPVPVGRLRVLAEHLQGAAARGEEVRHLARLRLALVRELQRGGQVFFLHNRVRTIGGIEETQEMLDFCGGHGITADRRFIPIQQINQAYDRMVKSDVKYRFSIDMASLKGD